MKAATRYPVLVVLGLVPLAFAFADHSHAVAAARTPAVVIDTAPPVQPSPALTSWSKGVEAVARAVRPAVVFIRASSRDSGVAMNQNPFPGFPWPFGNDSGNFQFFFHGPQGGRQPMFREAAGSGFIISRDGYIVTNAHVVRGADKLKVRLFDGRDFDAKVVGKDLATDVAVLKVDGHNLPIASFGNSDSSQVGDWVLAIGNPMGEALQFTVTAGIVSAKGRPLPDLPNGSRYGIQDFIQTDAAINPGNSGGPLVNVSGQVIGINSAIASQTGSYEGYGFAIPINLARPVINELISTGKVERAMIGISIRPVDSDDAAWAGLDSVQGVVVQGFSGDDSPARHSGLEPGDVIVALDGQPVRYTPEFQQAIAFRKPGDRVTLTVQRKGGHQDTIHVTLGRVPSSGTAVATSSPAVSSDTYGQKLGISVRPSDNGADYEHGLMVTQVDPEGPAAGKLEPESQSRGDVITNVDGKSVRSVAELNQALADAKSGDEVSIQTYNRSLASTRVVRLRVR